MAELRVIEGGAPMTAECQRCARQRDDVDLRPDLRMWLCDECEPLVRTEREARRADEATTAAPATRTAGSAAAALARELEPTPGAQVQRRALRPVPDPAPEQAQRPHAADDDGDDFSDLDEGAVAPRRRAAIAGIEPTAEQIARVLGARTGRATFPCTLHSSGGEATVTVTEAGYAEMRCECVGEVVQRPIGAAYAALHYGALMPHKTSAVEKAIWWRRLLWEAAGRPRLERVKVPGIERDAPDWLRKAHRGYALHRTLWEEGLDELRERPSPFARRFVQAWCGLSSNQAKEAIAALRERGVMREVALDGRTPLYLPGDHHKEL
jgi:hypothetical protein